MNDVPQPTDEKNDKEDNKINKKRQILWSCKAWENDFWINHYFDNNYNGKEYVCCCFLSNNNHGNNIPIINLYTQ